MFKCSSPTLLATDVDWGLVGSTVITGLVVVFLILAILVFFLWAFGKIFKAINGAAENREKKKAEAERAAQQTSKPVHTASVIPSPSEPEEELYEDEDDDEIIAVIAAAIAAYGAAEGKQYRIASIKRPRSARSGWSAAGIAENMRGFMN